MCGLPICSLWLRLEKLRQRVHWYPVSDDDCEDPQRVVIPTDVTDLVRPITTPSLSLRIAVITLFVLKVPLIPFHDSLFRILNLSSIPCLMDSAEVLLSAFCSIGVTQSKILKSFVFVVKRLYIFYVNGVCCILLEIFRLHF